MFAVELGVSVLTVRLHFGLLLFSLGIVNTKGENSRITSSSSEPSCAFSHSASLFAFC